MAQKVLTEILKYYEIIPPVVQNAAISRLLQESGHDIPEGIPALLAFSERHANGDILKKSMTNAFSGYYGGIIPELRLIAAACGLLYLSRSLIAPRLSYVWEELSQDMHDVIVGRPLADDGATVSMTVTELKELNRFADVIQARLDNAMTVQGDILTRNCELEDEVESLEEDVQKSRKQVRDDAASSNARIEALEQHIEIEQDGKESIWTERERYRIGGKKYKKDLDDLQAEYNKLEDEYQELKERTERAQGIFDDLTTERDCLQTKVGQLETDKEGLESSLAQKLAEHQAEQEKSAGLETANEFLKIDIEALQSEVRDHEEAAKEYQDICGGLEGEMKEQKRQLKAVREENAGFGAEIAALKAQLQAKEEKSGPQGGSRQDDKGDPSNNGASTTGQDENYDHDAADGSTGGENKLPPLTPNHGCHSEPSTPLEPESSAPSDHPSATASSKATGPSEVRNAHVRKLNEDVMKKAWRRSSGMPDADEKAVLAPEDEREIGTWVLLRDICVG